MRILGEQSQAVLYGGRGDPEVVGGNGRACPFEADVERRILLRGVGVHRHDADPRRCQKVGELGPVSLFTIPGRESAEQLADHDRTEDDCRGLLQDGVRFGSPRRKAEYALVSRRIGSTLRPVLSSFPKVRIDLAKVFNRGEEFVRFTVRPSASEGIQIVIGRLAVAPDADGGETPLQRLSRDDRYVDAAPLRFDAQLLED